MAIATVQGHVSRALDFYTKEGKYFSIGRTSPWDNESTPPTPDSSSYKIDELVALKKVDSCYLVVEDPTNGTIVYKDTKWRIVQPSIETTVSNVSGISVGDTTVYLTSLTAITIGSKLRIANIYEANVIAIDNSNNKVTLDTAAPAALLTGSKVFGGAYVEGAKYIYVDCTLSYDEFPVVTYRQVGFQCNVTPNNKDILRASAYSTMNVNEYTSLGYLEIIDNRSPVIRTYDQAEKISIILQF